MSELLVDSDGETNGQDSTPAPAPITTPKVAALHPKLTDAITKVIAEAKARGFSVGVYSGIRTPEEQDQLYALGRTVKNPDGYDAVKRPMGRIVTRARAWQSWHFYGLAVDVVFKTPDWDWEVKEELWDELGAIGKMFGLTWGGDQTAFPDSPHFQITGKIANVREAKRILFDEGLDKLWSLV